MKQMRIIIAFLFIAAMVISQDSPGTLRKKIEYSGEKSVTADIKLRKGTLNISPQYGDYLIKANFFWKSEEDQAFLEYDKLGKKGKLSVFQNEADNRSDIQLKFQDQEVDISEVKKYAGENQWDIQFSDRIPIDFIIDLGACEGDIDLTDLKLEDFSLDCGLSDVILRCKAPSKEKSGKFKISNGVGKFRSEYLGNARFKQLKLDCGLGSASVDLRGALQDGTDLDISVGLGSVTILIPENVGVKLSLDRSFLSSFSSDRFEELGNGSYISDNFDDSDVRLSMSISIGLGSVNIEWVN